MWKDNFWRVRSSPKREEVYIAVVNSIILRNLSCSVHSYPELEGNRNLGCINRDAVSKIREVRIPLPQHVIRPHLECCDEFRKTRFPRDTDTLEHIHRRVEEPALVCRGGWKNWFFNLDWAKLRLRLDFLFFPMFLNWSIVNVIVSIFSMSHIIF